MKSFSTQDEVSSITPFWLRLPRFFRYPVYGEPLVYMVFLSLLTVIPSALPSPAPLVETGFYFVIWMFFIRYAYTTLEQTAQGLLTPDKHAVYADVGRGDLPNKQIVIFLIFGSVISFGASIDPLSAALITTLCLLVLPASIILLSTTESFSTSLNPAAWFHLVRTMGLPYFLLCAFLFLLANSQSFLLELLAPRLSGWLRFPILHFTAMFFTLIMFNMLGYVIYQYHKLLGVSTNAGGAEQDAATSRARFNAEIGQLIADGKIGKAFDMAYDAQRVAPYDIAAHDRYHRFLELREDEAQLRTHTRAYITLLLHKGGADTALTIYRERLEHDPKFNLERPAQFLRLAKAARQRREYTEALDLIKDFSNRFPRDTEIPAVYLFEASVLCENLHEDERARDVLAVFLASYAEHPLRLRAQKLIEVIDKISSGREIENPSEERAP